MHTSHLAEQLRSYRPYEAPHLGYAANLSAREAEANLEYLLANRSKRLQIFGELLRADGIQLNGVESGDPKPLLDALYRWALRTWPDVADPSLGSIDIWLQSTRSGAEIVFSMLMDMSILLGELVVARRSEYQWSLDLDPDNGREGMVSYKRPVVLMPKNEKIPRAIVFDFEAIVVGQYFQARSPAFGALNEFSESVGDAISGAHEDYWLTQSER